MTGMRESGFNFLLNLVAWSHDWNAVEVVKDNYQLCAIWLNYLKTNIMQKFNRELLSRFTYLMKVKKYASNSITTYDSMLKLFFKHTKKQSKDISLNDFEIRKYILSLY